MTSSPSLLWAGLRCLTELSRTTLLRVQSQHRTPSLEPRTDQGGDFPTLAWGQLCCRLRWQLPTSEQSGHVVDLFNYGQVFFFRVFCCYSSMNISFIPSDAVGILDLRYRT